LAAGCPAQLESLGQAMATTAFATTCTSARFKVAPLSWLKLASAHAKSTHQVSPTDAVGTVQAKVEVVIRIINAALVRFVPMACVLPVTSDARGTMIVGATKPAERDSASVSTVVVAIALGIAATVTSASLASVSLASPATVDHHATHAGTPDAVSTNAA